LGILGKKSWNEQGVGDRVVDGARDHAHVPGKASHVDRTFASARFFGLIAIFKRIENKYLPDEEFFGSRPGVAAC